MITRDSSEFHSQMQRYVFIHPDDDVNDLEELRFQITDIDEMAEVGTPMDPDEGDVEYELYAILEPGEDFPLVRAIAL